MHQANDREIAALERGLATALSSDLEVSLEGQPVDDHRVSVPYFNRILEQLQAAFRSIRRASLSLGESLPRRESTLLLSGTAPGSFKAFLRAPTMQLDLLTAPEADVALLEIVNLFTSAQEGDIDRAVDWAERAPEPAVRSMIRLASTLAAGRGTTRFRLTSADQRTRAPDLGHR